MTNSKNASVRPITIVEKSLGASIIFSEIGKNIDNRYAYQNSTFRSLTSLKCLSRETSVRSYWIARAGAKRALARSVGTKRVPSIEFDPPAAPLGGLGHARKIRPVDNPGEPGQFIPGSTGRHRLPEGACKAKHPPLFDGR